MNLPENLSAPAKKVYELIANSSSPKSLSDLTTEYASQVPGKERYKAISTADSLMVKGIVTVEKGTDENTQPAQDTYVLAKGQDQVGPSEEADANEDYAKKTDANDEEKRMINILETHGKRLPATELFDLYMNEQTENQHVPAPDSELATALKELTDAGLLTVEGETYQVKE